MIWSHSYREGNRAAIAPRQLSGRGVAYWTDGKGDERVIYVTTGYRLIELNAKTGSMVQSFANGGVLDWILGGNGRGFARLDSAQGGSLFIGLSTRLGDTAQDGDTGKGSPFARAFAADIQVKGARIDDAFRRIADGKMHPTRQTAAGVNAVVCMGGAR